MPSSDLCLDEKQLEKLLDPMKCKCKNIKLSLYTSNDCSNLQDIPTYILKNNIVDAENGLVYNKSYDNKAIEGKGGKHEIEAQCAATVTMNDTMTLVVIFDVEDLNMKGEQDCAHGLASVTLSQLDCPTLTGASGPANLNLNFGSVQVILCLDEMKVSDNCDKCKLVTLTYVGVVPFAQIPQTAAMVDICFSFMATKQRHCED